MRRRELAALILGATVSPLPAVSGDEAAMPVVGVLSGGSVGASELQVDALRAGLAEGGYSEGKNVKIEYRWAEGHYERLQELASDLVRRRVAVIAAANLNAAVAAKNATSTTPIVFLIGDDPVRHGLAASFSHPGSNATGVSILVADLVAKRLDLLHELVPRAALIAALINPDNPNIATVAGDIQQASRGLGRRIEIVRAHTEHDIEEAFAYLTKIGAGALVVSADPFFASRRVQLVRLAARYAIPTIYEFRLFVEAGGLASYGPDIIDADRQLGAYLGKVLAGASPSDLPIMQPTKFELVINMKTAKQLALTIPPLILARADEVIE
jgi:ABC-type uncharacterized transport system substrate-binding protein